MTVGADTTIDAQPSIESAPLEFRYLTGRCANGSERDRGRRLHAVPPGSDWGEALCGARPGRLSAGWSTSRAEEASCPRCVKALEVRA